MRVGMVGFGYWGPNIVRNLERLGEAELVVACDAKTANLDRFSGQYPQIATCGGVDSMLDGHDLDAVVVATSVPTHHVVASKVLDAGLHCFVEKPLALTVTEAEDLVARAEKASVVLMVGHLMVYHGAIAWIRDYLASGELGEVRYAYTQRLNLGKVRAEENAFWSLAPHDVAVILDLLGETPESVSASGGGYLRGEVEDVVFANLHFPSGKMANVHVSWLDPRKVRRLTVVGEKQMLFFDDMRPTEKVWVYDKGVEPSQALAYGEDLSLRFGDVRVPSIQQVEPLSTELRHFLECCESGREPRTTGRHGLEVVRILAAADDSIARGGAPVALRESA